MCIIVETYPQTLDKLEDLRNFQTQKCNFHPGITQNRNLHISSNEEK